MQVDQSTRFGKLSEEDKSRRYQQLLIEVQTVLAEEKDPIVWMATIACLLKQSLGYFWVGFYRRQGRVLRIGPYQGTLGCLEIQFGRGVCGASALSGQTIVVPDVHKFPGHIACDARSVSEIVVPVFGADGQLKAVLDVDSRVPDAFSETDQKFLEEIVDGMRGLDWE